MIISLLVYVTLILSASNVYRATNVTRNKQKDDVTVFIANEIEIYDQLILQDKNSINAKLMNTMNTLFPEIKKVYKSLHYHGVIMDLHRSETKRFKDLDVTSDYNYANVIVDAMLPVLMLKDEKKRYEVIRKVLADDINHVCAELNEIIHREALKMSNYSEKKHEEAVKRYNDIMNFGEIVKKHRPEIEEDTFDWDTFVSNHFIDVVYVLRCNLSKTYPQHVPFYAKLALLLRLRVAEEVVSSIIKTIEKYSDKNIWRTTYIWFGSNISDEQAKKLTDAAAVANKDLSCYEVLQRFRKVVCSIIYADSFVWNIITGWFGNPNAYSYACDLAKRSELKPCHGFIHIFNSRQLYFLKKERDVSYNAIYKKARTMIAQRLKDETNKYASESKEKLANHEGRENKLLEEALKQEKANVKELKEKVKEKSEYCQRLQQFYERTRFLRISNNRGNSFY